MPAAWISYAGAAWPELGNDNVPKAYDGEWRQCGESLLAYPAAREL